MHRWHTCCRSQSPSVVPPAFLNRPSTLSDYRFAARVGAASAGSFIVLSIFLLTVLATSPALSETLKERADRICRAYIEQPEEFREIPTWTCDPSKTGPWGDAAQKCFAHAVEGLPGVQTFASVPTGGSCHSSGIERIGTGAVREFTPIRNASVNGYGFGSRDTALDYKGLLLITNGDDLRLQLDRDLVILCTFMYKLEGWEKPQPQEDKLCEALSNYDYTDRSSPIAEEESNAWPRYPEARLVRQVRSDLDDDGFEETVITYDYSSGAGCGCGAQPLLLLHGDQLVASYRAQTYDSTLPPKIKALGSALQRLTLNCKHRRFGTEWLTVNINGKDFVLADFRPGKWGIWPRDGAGDDVYYFANVPSREMYEFRNDRFVRVCEQKSITQKIIAHEVVGPAASHVLDYVPVTE